MRQSSKTREEPPGSPAGPLPPKGALARSSQRSRQSPTATLLVVSLRSEIRIEPRLRIDTTGERGNISLLDQRSRVIAQRAFPLDPPSPGALLLAMDALRQKSSLFTHHSSLFTHHSSLITLEVVPGPGRFSRVRLGVVTANALAWALGVPLFVHGRRVRAAVPEYGAEPSISLKPTPKQNKFATGQAAASRKLPERVNDGVQSL